MLRIVISVIIRIYSLRRRAVHAAIAANNAIFSFYRGCRVKGIATLAQPNQVDCREAVAIWHFHKLHGFEVARSLPQPTPRFAGAAQTVAKPSRPSTFWEPVGKRKL